MFDTFVVELNYLVPFDIYFFIMDVQNILFTKKVASWEKQMMVCLTQRLIWVRLDSSSLAMWLPMFQQIKIDNNKTHLEK